MLGQTMAGGVKSLVGPVSDDPKHAILVCFPHAGGGPSVFAEWRRDCPADMDLLAVQLPGREMRANEKLLRNAKEAAAQIGTDLMRLLAGRRPRRLVFYGHSLGALLAYEAARWLENGRGWGPDLLVLAGRRSPDLPLNRPVFHTLEDAEFLAEIIKMGGSPAGILDDPRLARFFLPTIRADVEMTDSYQFCPVQPLHAGIVAAYGDDDALATRPEVESWSRFTQRGGFRSVEFAGGHFFVTQARRKLMEIIQDEIANQ